MTHKTLHGDTERQPSGTYRTTLKIRDMGHVVAYGETQNASIRAALHKGCMALDCPHIFAVKRLERAKVCTSCGLIKLDEWTSV